ncbi:MAG: hypothetical protein PHP55_11550 [Methanoculleus sp.]|nr:hypothetical protein [Methanoculleus sp.]
MRTSPLTHTIAATTPPTTPLAPALTVEHLALRLHPLQGFADPLHVPVRLGRPGSRVVFSPVILVTFPESDWMPDPESLTVSVIVGNSGGETPAPPRPPPSSGEADHPRSRGSRFILQKTDTG